MNDVNSLLRIAAIVLFVLAALFAFGWITNQHLDDAIGCIALGLAAWGAAGAFPPRLAP